MNLEVRQVFAARLQALLKSGKISQATAGQWVGVSQTAVSDWVRGVTQPSIEQAAILAFRLGVSLDSLVGLDQSDNQERSEEAAAADLATLIVRLGVDEVRRRIRLADSPPPEPTQPRPIGRAPAGGQPVPVRRIGEPDPPPRPVGRAPATDQQVPVRRIGRPRKEEK